MIPRREFITLVAVGGTGAAACLPFLVAELNALN